MSYNPHDNFKLVGKNLYIGDFLTSINYNLLVNYNITHILVCAKELCCRYPETFTYKHLTITDLPETEIRDYFDEAHDFISKGTRNGRVLVHCAEAKSRSVSIVLSYFMKVNQLDYRKAHKIIKKYHPTAEPNKGFKKQLILYEREVCPRNSNCINSIF